MIIMIIIYGSIIVYVMFVYYTNLVIELLRYGFDRAITYGFRLKTKKETNDFGAGV